MFKVHINNRRFFNDVIAAIAGTDAEGSRKVSKVIDRKNKVPREVYEKELIGLGLDAEKIAKIDELYKMNVNEAAALCPDSKGAKELIDLFAALEDLGLSKYCVFDFGIIRGLDYYTGTVFEVLDEAPENNRAMFGGGRYDNLVGLFVKNTSVTGVGFGFGDVTLENFLVTHNLVPDIYKCGTKVLVTRFDDVPYSKYSEIVTLLRENGIVSSSYIGTKKFGKQIDYAVKDNYSHCLIMGASELEAGQVKIKNLDTREETVVAFADLVDYFKK
jgi:histidyl-tRNA synthetase